MQDHPGMSNDYLNKILHRVLPLEPIIPGEMKAAAAIGFMDWKERLRSTEQMLQKLSDGYPFA